MIPSTINYSTPDLFQGKTQAVHDLYNQLVNELNKIGPVRENKKEISISFENRKAFASALIRNRSIKLILRTDHRIHNARIRNTEHVAAKSFDHTILLASKDEIDAELLKWLQEAYEAGK